MVCIELIRLIRKLGSVVEVPKNAVVELLVNMNPEKPITPRGRGRSSWRQAQDHKELRRPRTDEKTGSTSKSSNCQSGAGGDVPQLNSTLSATAKEFYPKGYNPHQMDNCYNSQFTEVAQDAGDCSRYEVSSQLYQPDSVQIAINNLTELINHLTLNPGGFDAVIIPLVDTFKTWLSDENTIYAVVNVIVEQSIAEPNFRYTGARLCSFLNNEFSSAENTFRRTLLNRCKQVHGTMTENIYEDPESLRGYILFIAELFMQLEVGKEYPQRIQILGTALLEDLLLLLSTPTSENIKCVCQVLKLAGQALDMQDPLNMNPVIMRLSSLLNDPTIETNIHHLINNVVHLRELGWGEPSNVTSKPTTTQQYNSYLNEPVFYGPDGQIITPEESQFLQESFRQIPDDDYDDFGDDGEFWEPNEEMDEEHKAAFEQFLKMGKNQ